ncbi:MAG: ORC1-type DNA replication protein [Methanobrevibacter sp.]|jgi:cell division control protein 6|nr:ORC1-type DNA replication protein [Methanobrevibacter sp.]
MSIEDILMDGETIFRNHSAFNPDYMPVNYNFRDLQMEGMAISIRPALHNGRPVNTIILGQCATGKTTAIKKLFEKVEETSEKLICCYINCQLNTTRFGIFSQIYKKVFGHNPPETGIPFSRIYQHVMKHLENNNQGLLVALDDVNYLFQNQNVNKIFYDILRAYEEFPGIRTGIFAVLSDLEFRLNLEKNVNTVFSPQEIIFPLYKRDEVLKILNDRVKDGFYPNVMSDEIIEEITDYCFDSGDLRLGIDLLRITGNIAEAHGSRKIEQKHLDEAIASNLSINLENTISTLNDNEKKLLKIIALNKDTISTGKLSKEFQSKSNLSHSSFNRSLKKLEFLRLVDTKYNGKGSRGQSREVILRFNPDEICRCIL